MRNTRGTGRRTRPAPAETVRTLVGGRGAATLHSPDLSRRWAVGHGADDGHLTLEVDVTALPCLGLRLGTGEDAPALLTITSEAPLPDVALWRAQAASPRTALGPVHDVRPVGVDRYGVDLLCATVSRDGGRSGPLFPLRLPFAAPVDSAAEVMASVTALLDTKLEGGRRNRGRTG